MKKVYPTKLYPENTSMIYSSYLPLTQDKALGKVRETFVVSPICKMQI